MQFAVNLSALRSHRYMGCHALRQLLMGCGTHVRALVCFRIVRP